MNTESSIEWVLSVSMPGYLPDSEPDIFRATEAEARERFADEYRFQTETDLGAEDPDAGQLADMYASLPNSNYILICERIR